MTAGRLQSAQVCPRCGFLLSVIHGDEWWCERCPWDGTEADRLAEVAKATHVVKVHPECEP